jgi:hypothetical protein
MSTFVCRKCEVEKPLSGFTPNRWTPTGHTLKCKACCAEYARAFREKNPDKARSWGEKKHAMYRAKTPYKRVPRLTAEGRYCSSCKERKPDSEFGKSTVGPSGFNWRCKQCVRDSANERRYGDIELARAKDRAKDRVRYAKNREKRKEASANTAIKTKYGIARNAVEEMLAAQNGKCAICFKDIFFRKSSPPNSRVNVDHDHSTGAVRGLLCGPCNVGLGRFSDDKQKLRSAISYLARHAAEAAADG